MLCSTGRYPEAAFMARTYLPSHVSQIVKLWKEDLGKVNKKAADSLADPSEYENLFPEFQEALQAQFLKRERVQMKPAAQYKHVPSNTDLDVFEEMKSAKEDGSLDSILKSVESLTFSEPSASKPIEPATPSFAASSASPHSPLPPAPAGRPPATNPPAAEKQPDIDKKAAVKDDKDEELDDDFDFGGHDDDDDDEDLNIDDDDLLNDEDDDDLLDD